MKRSTIVNLVALSCGLTTLVSSLVADTANPTGATSAAQRNASWQQHRLLMETSPFRTLKWRSVGPRKQGGRIEAVAAHPSNPTTFYVGAGSGNLWKTVNNGTTWSPIFDAESTFAIGDIAVAPSDPNVVWVGTGEVLMARSSYAGTGVFKSVDAGQTWHNMGLPESHHIGRVLIDPQNADVVYVAVIGHLYTTNRERGLYKTTDAGQSWQKVLFIDDQTGVIDLAMDPTDSNTLYATTWQRSRQAWGHTAYGQQSGIYKTTDAGQTWQRLTAGLPVGDHVGRFAIDIAASNPNILYAICDCRDRDEGVYRSKDKGETWRQVNEDPVRAGYDFCLIKVSPDNENEIYVPGQRTYTSQDGGKTYRQIGGTIVHLLDHDSTVLHLDTHDMWVNPSNTDHLILGNDGGLFVSYDRGDTWLHLNNLPIGEFYDVTYDMATPYNIYGGTQDNAALFGPSNHVPQDGTRDPWTQVYLDRWGGGDSYHTPVDPTDANTIYYTHQFGDLRRKDMQTGKSKRIRPSAVKGEPPLRFNWMTPFFISHYDPATLYVGANALFKSTNRGDDWTRISEDLTTNPGPERSGNVPFGTITSVSESHLSRGLLYVGTDDGNVHVTRDGGDTWNRIKNQLPDRWVSRVVASRHHEATVYVALTGYRQDDFSTYLYKSSDYGVSWSSIIANLPAESVNVIQEDPLIAGLLYVGTDLGVYVSINGGTAWQSLCNHLPTTPVHDLVVHPRARELIIGTHGRSIYVLDVSAIQDSARPSP
ncbi:MAG: hypothetical protein VX346_22805 [Planctomycetota bacterium]|nr:hypothetical protein [Planctomycetota bacterium]